MVTGLFRLRSWWSWASQANSDTGPRLSRRLTMQRKINQSFLRIREVKKEDETCVRNILFDHFRQLTFPAITYWIVQHVYDLLAIIAILSFILPIKHIVYFCVAFLVYLYIRARYEMEKHIRNCCPDLDAIYETYCTAQGANFWVGYFSNEDAKDEANPDKPAGAQETRSREASVDREDKDGANATSEKPSDKEGGQPDAVSNGENMHKGGDDEKQPLLGRTQVETQDEPPMKLKDILNKTKCKENEILGCIGIAPYRNKSTIAQMVRLVVSKKCRNMKVGSRLLSHLEKYAVSFGYTEIRVYTNNLNTAYLQFLKQNGFVIQQLVRRGLMRGDLIIWNKTLSQPKDLLVPGTPYTQKQTMYAETQAIVNMGATVILE